jgi:hypothetical protein
MRDLDYWMLGLIKSSNQQPRPLIGKLFDDFELVCFGWHRRASARVLLSFARSHETQK